MELLFSSPGGNWLGVQISFSRELYLRRETGHRVVSRAAKLGTPSRAVLPLTRSKFQCEPPGRLDSLLMEFGQVPHRRSNTVHVSLLLESFVATGGII